MDLTWSLRFRVTNPLAGGPVVYDASAWKWCLIAAPQYSPIFTEIELIDYSIEHHRYGWRRTARLEFEFDSDDAAAEAAFATILSCAQDPDVRWLVEVSLDGGANYAEVELQESQDGPIDDKFIGLYYRTLWTFVQPLKVRPALLTGAF